MGIFDLFKPNVEKMKAKKDIKGLIKTLKHKDSNVRLDAELALISIGEPAVEVLTQALNDEVTNVRIAAARALGNIRDKRAVRPLIQALKDKDSKVRGEVAWALSKIGEPAVEPFINELKNGKLSIQKEIVWFLLEIGGVRALEPLIQIRKSGGLKGLDLQLILKVNSVIENIRDSRAVEPLIQALKDGDYYTRCIAAKALGNIRDSKSCRTTYTSFKG